jgi:tetratricopeptide (TPR) repeat protein
MRRHSQGWRGQGPGRLVVWMAVLAFASGCSGSANPVNRLKARVRLKEGNLSYLAGEYGKAIQSYDAALHLVPHLAPALLNRAYSQEALFRVAQASEERQKLADEAVGSFATYLTLVASGPVGLDSKAPGPERIEEHILTLLVESQQIDKAVDRLQMRVEKDPRDATALEMLSRLELERGNLDQAAAWQRKRVEAEPKNADAQYGLGAFMWLMSYRDPAMNLDKRMGLLEEGVAALQRANELRPDDFETLIYINLLYREMAKYAVKDADRSTFEAQAQDFRDRALKLRKASPDSSAAVPPG